MSSTRSLRMAAYVAVLAVTIALGGALFLMQLRDGLGITGLSRDVAWGFYLAQLYLEKLKGAFDGIDDREYEETGA